MRFVMNLAICVATFFFVFEFTNSWILGSIAGACIAAVASVVLESLFFGNVKD